MSKNELIIHDVLPYLGHGLNVEILNYQSDYVGKQFSTINGFYYLAGMPHFTYEGGSTGKSFKEIDIYLRPINHETLWRPEFLEYDNYMFETEMIRLLEYIELSEKCNKEPDIIKFLSLKFALFLIKNQFDINRLIKKGKAKDINILKV